MPVPPVVRDAITQALRELGPMSAEEFEAGMAEAVAKNGGGFHA